MIQSFGGDKWIHFCLNRWVRKTPSRRAKFREHGAWDIYAETFKSTSVLSATCDDYRAGGVEDAEEQERDQREGNKINCNVRTMNFFSLLSAAFPSDLNLQRSWLKLGGPCYLLIRLSRQEVRREGGLE
jgi:hypothetical protein